MFEPSVMFEPLVGYGFVSYHIKDRDAIDKKVRNKIEELQLNMVEEFYKWLNSQGLEMEMGVIIEKEN